MKTFGSYLSKYLLSFGTFALFLLVINILAFVVTFFGMVSGQYGPASPAKMLESTAAVLSPSGIPEKTARNLQRENIWALYLDEGGNCLWSVSLPEEVPVRYSIQDVAVFSKGYLKDYPVFVRSTEDGLLILGYPKDSFMKITGNYFPLQAVRLLPLFAVCVLAADMLILFLAYCFSKRKISKSTEPIMASIKELSAGQPVELPAQGELSEIADSVNRASLILSRQNEARANWISGVSHDIRTPLSMIVGYAQRIADDSTTGGNVRQEAEIIRRQSLKIKDLVQDLNLVSRLEYEMQPLHKEPVRLSRLLRGYTAELLNAGIGGEYSVEVAISPDAENDMVEGDARLLSRAVGNLVQNSINHNPKGCTVRLCLGRLGQGIILTVADDGAGLSAEKLRELEQRPHYMESTDERLDLRHGLGLLLVKQIVKAHGGELEMESSPGQGLTARLRFQRLEQ